MYHEQLFPLSSLQRGPLCSPSEMRICFLPPLKVEGTSHGGGSGREERKKAGGGRARRKHSSPLYRGRKPLRHAAGTPPVAPAPPGKLPLPLPSAQPTPPLPPSLPSVRRPHPPPPDRRGGDTEGGGGGRAWGRQSMVRCQMGADYWREKPRRSQPTSHAPTYHCF